MSNRDAARWKATERSRFFARIGATAAAVGILLAPHFAAAVGWPFAFREQDFPQEPGTGNRLEIAGSAAPKDPRCLGPNVARIPA